MLWIVQLWFILYWSQVKSVKIGYEHDTIPDNNHRQVTEEKELWLDDFTNKKVKSFILLERLLHISNFVFFISLNSL